MGELCKEPRLFVELTRDERCGLIRYAKEISMPKKLRTIMSLVAVLLLIIAIMMMLAQASIVPSSTGGNTPTAYAAPTAHYVTVPAPQPTYQPTPTALVTQSPYATDPAGS